MLKKFVFCLLMVGVLAVGGLQLTASYDPCGCEVYASKAQGCTAQFCFDFWMSRYYDCINNCT